MGSKTDGRWFKNSFRNANMEYTIMCINLIKGEKSDIRKVAVEMIEGSHLKINSSVSKKYWVSINVAITMKDEIWYLVQKD